MKSQAVLPYWQCMPSVSSKQMLTFHYQIWREYKVLKSMIKLSGWLLITFVFPILREHRKTLHPPSVKNISSWLMHQMLRECMPQQTFKTPGLLSHPSNPKHPFTSAKIAEYFVSENGNAKLSSTQTIEIITIMQKQLNLPLLALLTTTWPSAAT